MGTVTTSMLIVFLLAGGITTLAMLSVFANAIRHETQLHDLRNRVKELHYQHAMYLAKISGQISEEGEIEILNDDDEVVEAIEVGEIVSESESESESNPPKAQSLPEPPETPNLVAA